ncbi:MAG: T9SS type A sorting domain-containing protein [Ignavibacteriae bacterium]|nr:T9SS type A sorting domain-containing protein [Ignavibacteriota bacterium]
MDEYIILSVEPKYWEDLPDSIQNGATVQDTFFIDYVRVYKKDQTDVKENTIDLLGFSLLQNYPNPFNPSTNIKYSIPSSGSQSDISQSFVTLKVYDLFGKEIAVLINKQQNPGSYSVKFDASELSSGIYFCKLMANNFSQTKKMIVLK